MRPVPLTSRFGPACTLQFRSSVTHGLWLHDPSEVRSRVRWLQQRLRGAHIFVPVPARTPTNAKWLLHPDAGENAHERKVASSSRCRRERPRTRTGLLSKTLPGTVGKSAQASRAGGFGAGASAPTSSSPGPARTRTSPKRASGSTTRPTRPPGPTRPSSRGY